jgi:hypothetical protein
VNISTKLQRNLHARDIAKSKNSIAMPFKLQQARLILSAPDIDFR